MEIPVYASAVPDTTEDCWYDINFPQFIARFHITYKHFTNAHTELSEICEEHRRLIYKHISKLNALKEIPISRKGCYGTFTELKGEVGTPAQFLLTDSVSNVLTLALYFRTTLKTDSLLPVADQLKEDMWHIVSTLRWGNPVE